MALSWRHRDADRDCGGVSGSPLTDQKTLGESRRFLLSVSLASCEARSLTSESGRGSVDGGVLATWAGAFWGIGLGMRDRALYHVFLEELIEGSGGVLSGAFLEPGELLSIRE